MPTIDQIKKLREKTGAGIMDCRRALEEVKGDGKKAEELLAKWGIEKAEKKVDRVTNAGIVDAYIHAGGKVGVLVELLCETDFVAKTDQFEQVGKDLAMQVASMGDEKFEDQDFIKDGSRNVKGMIKELIAKTGENVKLGRVEKIELGGK